MQMSLLEVIDSRTLVDIQDDVKPLDPRHIINCAPWIPCIPSRSTLEGPLMLAV